MAERARRWGDAPGCAGGVRSRLQERRRGGRPLSLRSQVEPVDVENVGLVSRKLYSIATVAIIAEGFPWDRYSSVEVHLRYDDETNGIRLRDMIRLTEKEPDGS